MSSSDSEEFYDAEEKPNSLDLTSRTSTKPLGLGLDLSLVSDNKLSQSRLAGKPDIEKSSVKGKRSNESESWRHNVISPTKEEVKEAERKAKENERRRRRIEEQRRRMLTEEDDLEPPSSGQSSKTSSVDGVYAITAKPGSKLPVGNEEDQSSIISLGKVGSLLGDNISLDSRESVTEACQKGYAEPDLVASTKCSSDAPPVPVRPPRKNRKALKAQSSLDTSQSLVPPSEASRVPELPSPSSAVDSIAQELEFSLDLRSAIRGKYVVKPQDFEKNRAPAAAREPDKDFNPNSDAINLEPSSTSSANETAPQSLDFTSLQISGLGSINSKNGIGNGNSLSRSSRGSSKSGSLQEDSICQMNIMMRTRSDSGRPLTDLEILEQVTVLNLDTGEQIPLSKAEDHLPKGINPLSLHLMRLTSEYVSNSRLDKCKESDDEGSDVKKSDDTSDASSHRSRRQKLKEILGKTVNKIKTVADDVYHSKHSEELESSDEDMPMDLKFKASSSHKGPYEFDNIRVVQELPEHTGAIWTMKFSVCGRMLATAGQDHKLRIWVLKDAFSYFDDMRQKYNAEAKVSPTPSQESLISQHNTEDATKNQQQQQQQQSSQAEDESGEDNRGPFMSHPICTYEGHTADVLDLSWSKNHFILSSSMDKTVRLWHITRKECLCCFQHSEFVTAIAFHPRDDRYFLSGSLDGRLRLWNIPDKKVAVWNEVEGQSKFITAVNFCQNGRFAVIGSYDGRCVFYYTEQLKYHTQIHVRSSRGKNAKGRKISGIEPLPGEDKILIASNDSRIRLYDLRNQSLACKYKGYVNQSSQNRASFSSDGKYIISGSENHLVYIWKTQHDISKFSSARRDLNHYWEGIKAHNAVVTAAVFAPYPALILSNLDQCEHSASSSSAPASSNGSYVFVSADFNGAIKVFAKKKKCKSTPMSS